MLDDIRLYEGAMELERGEPARFRQAAFCYGVRNLLLPALAEEIAGRSAVWHIPARFGLRAVRRWLEGYVARSCP
jgi:hypothetical protein